MFDPNVCVQDVSEGDLIKAFASFLPQGADTVIPTGDDCAVVNAPHGDYVVSTDVIVEDVHYYSHWSTGRDVGWRVAAQNVADVCAMGARPSALVAGVALSPTTAANWVVDFARGLADYCAPLNIGVVGGDITQHASDTAPVVCSATAFGSLDFGPAVTRAGAKVGDLVGVMGTLGMSRTGFELLRTFGPDHDFSDAQQQAVDIYKRPQPPVEHVMEMMRAAGNGADAGGDGAMAHAGNDATAHAGDTAAAQVGATRGATRPHAMMDVSDGLVKDARRMAKASGVTISLDSDALQLFTAPIAQCGYADCALDYVLSGGEDHSMLMTFQGLPPKGAWIIGHVNEGGPFVLLDDMPYDYQGGWDHATHYGN